MVGWLFGDAPVDATAKERLQDAGTAVVDGFGPREGRRTKDGTLAAAEGFQEAGDASRKNKRKSDRDEVAELRAMFSRQPWDNTPFRSRPAALIGLLPVTREPWAYDEEVYNRNFGTRDVGVPER